jgi:hypothetical protein
MTATQQTRRRDGQFGPGRHDEVPLDLTSGEWPDDRDFVPPDDPFAPGAITWHGAGFTPDEAREWADAGVAEPEIAEQARMSGITPHAASYVWARDRESTTLGQALTSGRTSIAAAAAWAPMERERLASGLDIGF